MQAVRCFLLGLLSFDLMEGLSFEVYMFFLQFVQLGVLSPPRPSISVARTKRRYMGTHQGTIVEQEVVLNGGASI